MATQRTIATLKWRDSTLAGHLYHAFMRTRRNALNQGIPFNLTTDDMRYLHTRQQGRCALTDQQFSESRRGPVPMAVHRLISSIGFERRNVILTIRRPTMQLLLQLNQQHARQLEHAMIRDPGLYPPGTERNFIKILQREEEEKPEWARDLEDFVYGPDAPG